MAHWSQQAERLFGWTESEVRGLHPMEWPFVADGDRDGVAEVIGELLNGSAKRNASSNRNLTRDGDIVECVWHNSIRRYPDGRIQSVLSFVIDVSEQKRARAEAEGLSGRLTSTLESITDAFFTLDADWRFTYVNAAAERVLQLRRKRLLGAVFWDAFPGAVSGPIEHEFRHARATQRAAEFEVYYTPLAAWFQIRVYPGGDDLTVYLRDLTRTRHQERTIRKLSSVAERTANGVLILDPQGRVEWVNDGFESMSGYTLGELQQRDALKALSGPETDAGTAARWRGAIRQATPFEGNFLHYRRCGTPYYVRAAMSPVFDDGGNIENHVVVQQDVTEELQREQLLELRAERLESMVAMSQGLVTARNPVRFLDKAVRTARRHLGALYVEITPPQGAGSATDPIVAVPRHFQRTAAYRQLAALRQDIGRLGKDGASLLLAEQDNAVAHTVPIRVGRGVRGGVLAVIPGDTGWQEEDRQYLALLATLAGSALLRAEQEDELVRLAFEDPLTGLANRRMFHHEAHRVLELVEREEGHAALLHLDVSNFNSINDGLGQQAGDQLLRNLATLLRASVRESDVVARLAGDEFGIFLPFADGNDAIALARRILRKLRQPLAIGDREVYCRMRIAIASHPEHGPELEDLVRRANLALQRAKQEQRSPIRFDWHMEDATLVAATGEAELRRGLSRGEFYMVYQPLVDARSGDVTEYEALVRWQHAYHGAIAPNHFIPIAEDTGLIRQIDRRALVMAIRAANRHGVRVSVNLSPVTLEEPSIGRFIRRCLAKADLSPEALTVEITEHVLVDADRVRPALDEITRLGVAIAIDDFGTGYSSLSVIPSYSFSRLKVDRSFVRGLDAKPVYGTTIQGIVALAHGLSMDCVIEGVETREQVERLRQFDADLLQGFHFGRPGPLPEPEPGD